MYVCMYVCIRLLAPYFTEYRPFAIFTSLFILTSKKGKKGFSIH